MTGEREAGVVPVASANVDTFSQTLQRVWATVLSSVSRWIESIGEVASSDRFQISDCG